MEKLYGQDLSGQVFYKISKSCPEISSLCAEPHYIDYHPKTLVKDTGAHRLCFVPAEFVIRCIPYGDQLTEITFDSSSPFFPEIANLEIKRTNPVFNEFNSEAVITGNNYSLSNPQTMAKIIAMASPELLHYYVTLDDCADRKISITKHLERLGFLTTLDYWRSVIDYHRNRVHL